MSKALARPVQAHKRVKSEVHKLLDSIEKIQLLEGLRAGANSGAALKAILALERMRLRLPAGSASVPRLPRKSDADASARKSPRGYP